MRFDLDDPRLTAYALGELDDDAEREALEAHIKSDPEASRFVDEIRATAELLTQHLRAEAGPALAESHRQAIEELLVPRAKIPYHAYAIAASLFLALSLGLLWPAFQAPRAARRTSETVVSVPPPAGPDHFGRIENEAAVTRGLELADARSPAAAGLEATPPSDVADLPAAALDLESVDRLEGLRLGEAEVVGKPVRKALTYGATTANAPREAAPATGPAPAQRAQRHRGLDSAALAQRSADAAGAAPGQAVITDGSVQLYDEQRAMGGIPGSPPAPKAGAPSSVGFALSREPGAQPPARRPAMRADALAGGGQPVAGQPIAALPELRAGLADEGRQVRQQAEQLLKQRDKNDALAELPPPPPAAPAEFNREAFNPIVENEFVRVLEEPQSTFSIDVDTASYAIVRRYLMDQSILPPRDAVRIEELANYFKYDYPQPNGDDPFSVHVEIARCPWNAAHRLARIGLKGRAIQAAQRPASNLVFLVDVSGSMNEPDKLPLVQDGLRMLVHELGENDRVAIVVYAGSEGLALDSTSGQKKAEILRAIDEMRPGGSTHASAGIQLAYDIAARNFIPGGVNRVILATDGDFNVGVTDDGALQTLIAEKAKSKVFLTVLGVGRGNLQDAKMEGLADKGNGNYHYLDSPREAHKVLVEEAGGNLVTIAKDVKIQVNFNPVKVGAYRLLGYENRRLANRDFKDDAKDAGEIGAGHTVTALYELVPAGNESKIVAADRPRFVKPAEPADPHAPESFIVSLRFKKPEGDTSEQRDYPVIDDGKDYAQAGDDFKFAAAVTSFGLVLRDSKFKGNANLDAALELAEASKGSDPGGHRAEFLELVRKAKALVPAR
jgi:Ca-activated chloride channel family protein